MVLTCVASAAILAVTGCGASTTNATPPAGSAAPGSSAAPGTTGTAPPPKPTMVPESDAAKKAVITQADLGANWKELSPAAAFSYAPDNCGASGFGPLQKGSGWVGAMARRGESGYYVASSATVFPTEAEAIALVDLKKSPAYIECVRVGYEQLEKTPGITYAVYPNTNPAVGTDHWEAQTIFQARFAENGTVRDANGRKFRQTYRFGTTVISTALEGARAEGETAETLQQVNAEYDAAVASLYKRMAA